MLKAGTLHRHWSITETTNATFQQRMQEELQTPLHFFKPKHYNITQPPKPEEVMIEAARQLGRAMKEVAMQNTVYPELEPYKQLKRIMDSVKNNTVQLTQTPDNNIQLTSVDNTDVSTQPQPNTPIIIPAYPDKIDVTPPRVRDVSTTQRVVTARPQRIQKVMYSDE